ncbi:MAG: alpha/beta fold hydrolase [Candidatus Obscuribacterales bacterium]|nr:alpha/beta fold hydrolase [Candidatus Obscuribacterales bacterium]
MAKVQVKQRTLVIALIVSLLLNALAIVGLFFLLHAHRRIKGLNAENQALKQSVISAKATTPNGEQPDLIQRRDFVSHLDSKPDAYLLVPPRAVAPGDKFVLIVYFHCMGGDVNEPFMLPTSSSIAHLVAAEGRQYVLASLSYRQKISWCNEAACADATQNIRELMQAYPFEKIVLMGTSMGGSAVLTYSALAPDDIKKLISGVVSVEGAGDLGELYRTTASNDVRRALTESFGGVPETSALYSKQSISANIDKVNPTTKFAIVSAANDTIVPTALQKQVAKELETQHFSVKLIEAPGSHGVPSTKIYREALRFVL